MNINGFVHSFAMIVSMMSPYLLLGFLIAGVLHVFVPSKFYRKYLSKNNKLSVLWAALIGIPLPLCSCGVIPTAVGLKNEGASKGAVASFLIATPQTGVDSILATFSLMGLGFAILRPAAALVTGVCGGFLIERFVKDDIQPMNEGQCVVKKSKNKILEVFRYAFIDMFQNIGLRLFIGLLIAALINIAIPEEFFLRFGNYPFLQMLIILLIAIPMYVCSTGSIPIAAALIAKGLTPGAALVMLMAGPAVNMASILVIRKSIGKKFCWIYILTIVVGAMFFGFLTNILDSLQVFNFTQMNISACCTTGDMHISWFANVCSILLLIFLLNAFIMSLIQKFRKPSTPQDENTKIYNVEGMHCSHCKNAVEQAVLKIKGITEAEANLAQKTLVVKGKIDDKKIEKAVVDAGFSLSLQTKK